MPNLEYLTLAELKNLAKENNFKIKKRRFNNCIKPNFNK